MTETIAMFGNKKAEAEKPKKKMLLDPDQPREDVTETGGVSARRYTEEKTPDVAGPGVGVQADGQTTHE
jgi:hypothetical protein